MSRLTVDDLPADVRRKLKLRRSRQTKFSMEQVRRHAIVCLAEISELSQAERTRVLNHAIKINRA